MNYPLDYYKNTEHDNLLFHLMNVGEGLMCLIIFPDQKTLLFDCNVTNDNEDAVISYLGRQIPYRWDQDLEKDLQWIDVFVNSHRDDDHYRGLSKINAKYPVKSIWDSGQSGATTQSSDYQYYMRLRRTLKDKYGENAVIVPKPSQYPLATVSGADIYCLNSALDYDDNAHYLTFAKLLTLVESKTLIEGKPQHTNSIVLSVKYKNRVLLLTGDSDYLAWRDKIVPYFESTGILKTDILVASHHGSRSFFTDENLNDNIDPEENPETTYIDHIYEISPSLTVIPCGNYDSAHHPNKEALKIYEENTTNEQVYTTHEKWNLTGFVGEDGRWTVVPSRMYPWKSGKSSFSLKCVCTHNGSQYEVESGEALPLGSSLRFSIHSSVGILDPYANVSVVWEVSNGGINDHHENQHIYYKSANENKSKYHFEREVSYEGRHLLRCFVHNKKKKIKATKVFVVNGEPQ
ncbi:MAG: nucleotide-binding domain-containing protein [Thermodesulfobacteriota bacterium]